MGEFVKSITSAWLALSLLGLKQAQDLVSPRNGDTRTGPVTQALGSLTDAATDQFDNTFLKTFQKLDNLQREMWALGFDLFLPMVGDMSGIRTTAPGFETHHQYDRDYRPQPALAPEPFAAGPGGMEEVCIEEYAIQCESAAPGRAGNGHAYRVSQIGDDHAI